ncbi:hypothetical protein [Streptomyces sp. CAU 1734]|uniref:hypothetical protein n=1 Tax=Streptomyces sp. CAU 1734 TaxID=3140360 RepID=UPI0032612A77
MAGLVAAALTTVGFLAYQASASAPAGLGDPRAPRGAATADARQGPRDPLALPPDSGSGTRVVYALEGRRVWLVGERNRVARTFAVMPSTVNPPPGAYVVTSRSGRVHGSDGVTIEHVVRFASVDDVVVGFSAALDGSMASPDPERQTGGVRMKRADGKSMWRFATIGSKVVVVG